MKRVTITVPAELLKKADAEARRLDRSRSWVIADALKGGLATEAASASRNAAVVREPTVQWDSAFARARDEHVAADLKLSPEERLSRATGMARFADAVHPARQRHQVLAFDSYDEFYAWKTAQRLVV